MKIRIEVELANAEEYAQAAELIAVCKEITDQLRITQAGSASDVITTGLGAVAIGGQSGPAGMVEGTGVGLSRPGPALAGAPPSPSEVAARFQSGILRALEADQRTIDLIAADINDTIAAVVRAPAAGGGAGDVATITQEVCFVFVQAFCSVAFGERWCVKEKSTLPFLRLLPSIQIPYRNVIAQEVFARIVNQLALPRDVSADRSEFFDYAEAFAGLLSMGFVPLVNGLQLIAKLLASPSTSCAAVTMLGKTIEACSAQLREPYTRDALEQLRVAFNAAAPNLAEYDVRYMCQHMGWEFPAPVPKGGLTPGVPSPAGQPLIPSSVGSPASPADLAAKPASPGMGVGLPLSTLAEQTMSGYVPPTRAELVREIRPGQPAPGQRDALVLAKSWPHDSTVTAMGWDDANRQAVSCTKKGQLCFWAAEDISRPRNTMPVDQCFATMVEFNPKYGCMFLCAAPMAADPEQAKRLSGSLYVFSMRSTERPPILLGRLESQKVSRFTAVKTWGVQAATNCFITAEVPPAQAFTTGSPAAAGSAAKRGWVCLYDAGRMATGGGVPLSQFDEHGDVVTALATHSHNPYVFFSGSRDVIKQYDTRQSAAVTSFAGHSGTVTAIDVLENFMVSGSMDKSGSLWDLRKAKSGSSTGSPAPAADGPADGLVRKVSPDGKALLKVKIGTSLRRTAISTLGKLFLVDLSCMGSEPVAARVDGEARYADLAFDLRKDVLYGSSDRQSVDVFRIENDRQ